MTFKMKNMKYWKAKNNIPGINNDFEKGNNLPDGRSTSSPFQKNEKKDPYTKEDEDFLKAQREEKVHAMDYLSKTKKGPYATDDDTKEGNVSAYLRKNQQYVDKDKTIPLDPGYEDTEKIQKVQREGITPYSQKFGNFKAKQQPIRNIRLKEVKVSPKKKKG